MLVAERSGPGLVRFEDIGLARTHQRVTPEDCTQVATVDGGRPVLARLGGTTAALLAGQPVPFRGCGEELALGEGPHRISSAGPIVVDDLWMTSTGGGASAGSSAPGPVDTTLDSSSPTRRVVRLGAGCDPCYVSSGQGYDPRWAASVDGRSLGQPLVVDGYAAGWRVQAPPGAVVEMVFGPRRAALLAWAVSALVLLGCVVLLVRRAVRGAPVLARDAGAVAPAADPRPPRDGRGHATPLPDPFPRYCSSWRSSSPWDGPPPSGPGQWRPGRCFPARSRRYLDAALVLLLAVPVVVLVARPDGLVQALQHIQDGWPAHQLAGLGLWLLLAGAVPAGVAAAPGPAPSTMTPDVDHPR